MNKIQLSKTLLAIVITVITSLVLIGNVSAKKKYSKTSKRSKFSKKSSCPKSPGIINLDDLTKREMNSKKSSYKKLKDSQKVCSNGRVTTLGQLKNMQKRKVKMVPKKRSDFTRKSKRKYASEKSAYGKLLRNRNKKKVRGYNKIKTNFKLKKVFILPPTMNFTISQPTPPDSGIPVITNLTVRNGQPGDGVVLTGTKFGTRRGTVKCQVKPGTVVNARIELWSDNGCAFKIPGYSGMASNHSGNIIVRTAEGKESAQAVFVFKPEMVIKRLCCFNPDIRSGSCENITGPGGGSTQTVEEDGFFNCSHSSFSSVTRFFKIVSGIWILPMSCKMAAVPKSESIFLGKPNSFPTRRERSATFTEW